MNRTNDKADITTTMPTAMPAMDATDKVLVPLGPPAELDRRVAVLLSIPEL